MTTNLSTYAHDFVPQITPEDEIRRVLLAIANCEGDCLVNGLKASECLALLLPQVTAQAATHIALVARSEAFAGLTTAAHYLAREMAKIEPHKAELGKLLPTILLSVQDVVRFAACFAPSERAKYSAQVKKGLAWAIGNLGEEQLAKATHRERRVLSNLARCCHPKPPLAQRQGKKHTIEKFYPNQGRAVLLRHPHSALSKLIEGRLPKPSSQGKAAVICGDESRGEWEAHLKANRIGAAVILKNLQAMQLVGVDGAVISNALDVARVDSMLPIEFVRAMSYREIAPALSRCLERNVRHAKFRLMGKTAIVAYPSNQGGRRLSKLVKRAAIGIREQVVLLKNLCDKGEAWLAGGRRLGISCDNLLYADTQIPLCSSPLKLPPQSEFDRIIVVTDVPLPSPAPAGRGYWVNLAHPVRGVAFGEWVEIAGYPDDLAGFIFELEGIKTST